MSEMKKRVIITRSYKKNCTTGELQYGDFKCKTLELPNLDNKVRVSCIPESLYRCRKIISPSLGECIDIKDVPGRTYIRIHAGNFTRQILGCVLVGEKLIDFDGDGITDVTSSRKTLSKLMSCLPNSFLLEIKS